MKVEDTAKDKVKKICDVLRRDTLEPAEAEAKRIVQEAKAEAEKIVQEAKELADALQKQAKEEIAREKNVFASSLNQACKQSLQSLHEEIEGKFFNEQLSSSIQEPLNDPKALAKLIEAVLTALEKEGVEADLEAFIPKAVSAKEVNDLLLKQFVERLAGKSVKVGPAKGGIEVKVSKENMKIEATDEALKELVARYIRKDFREMLFKAN